MSFFITLRTEYKSHLLDLKPWNGFLSAFLQYHLSIYLFSISMLQTHWLSFCSSALPRSFLPPHGLCTSCSPCLEFLLTDVRVFGTFFTYNVLPTGVFMSVTFLSFKYPTPHLQRSLPSTHSNGDLQEWSVQSPPFSAYHCTFHYLRFLLYISQITFMLLFSLTLLEWSCMSTKRPSPPSSTF